MRSIQKRHPRIRVVAAVRGSNPRDATFSFSDGNAARVFRVPGPSTRLMVSTNVGGLRYDEMPLAEFIHRFPSHMEAIEEEQVSL